MGVTVVNKKSISNPFCDRLSLTVPLPDKGAYIHVMNKLEDLACDSTIHKKSDNKHYDHSFVFYTDEKKKSSMYFQFMHKNPDYNPIRMDFNPAKCDMSVIREYVDYIIPDGWDYVVRTSSVTRVDVAIDFYDTYMDDVIVDCYKKRKAIIYLDGGKLTGYQYGSDTSSSIITLYDKTLEQKIKKNYMDKQVVRLESKCKKLSLSLEHIASIDNPFTHFNVYDYKPLNKDASMRFVVETARDKGLKRVKHLLDDDKQLFNSIKKKFEGYKSPWWNPGLIWEGWSQQANMLINPPPAPGFLDL